MNHRRLFILVLFPFLLAGALFCRAEEGKPADSSLKPVTLIDMSLAPDKPSEVFTAWLIYASVRRAYKKETFFKENPGAKACRYTFREELEARRMLADVWVNLRKENSSLSDVYLDALLEVKKAGLLAEYVWYFFWDRGWGDTPGTLKMAAFNDYRLDHLVHHAPETVTHPGEARERNQKDGSSASSPFLVAPAYSPPDDGAGSRHFERGFEYQKNKDYAGAIDEYLKVIQRYPGRTDAMDNLGLCYRAAGNYDEAEKWYGRSLKLDPGNTAALVNLAVVYRLRGKQDKAVELYERVTRIDSGNPEGYYGLGSALYESGRFEESVRSMDKAIDGYKRLNSPYLYHGYYIQGLSYMALKDWQKAIEQFGSARRGLPGDEGLKNGIELARKQLEKKVEP